MYDALFPNDFVATNNYYQATRCLKWNMARSSQEESIPKSERAPSFTLNKTSDYFSRSPSSAMGSVQRLGSLVETLIGHSQCCCFSCLRANQTLSNDEMVLAISDHFGMCMVFKQKVQKSLRQEPISKDFNKAISSALCHLCRHNCYLRAFSPARDWYSLRLSICHYGNISPDDVLKGWKCYLSVEVGGTEDTGLKPKVLFAAANGKVFDNGDGVLKALGFVDCSTQRMHVKNSSPAAKAKVHPTLRSLQYKDRSIIESELISSSPMYGIKCICKENSVRKTSARRALFSVEESTESADIQVSPFGLLEELFIEDPWRLLISTILLNRTCRDQVDFIMHQLLEEYPNARSMANGDFNIISNIIRPIGMRYRRAETLRRFSKEYTLLLGKYLEQKNEMNLSRSDITGLYGCGEYAADAYEIFVLGKHGNISTSDHALQYFVDFKRGNSHG